MRLSSFMKIPTLFINRLFAIFILSLIVVGCGGEGNSGSATKQPTATLVDLQVSVVNQLKGSKQVSIPLGEDIRFLAVAVYSDKTKKIVSDLVSWTSATPVLDFKSRNKNDLAKATSLGDTQVSATYKGIKSQLLSVTVTDASLKAIEVKLSSKTVTTGGKYLLSAWGSYSDQTKRDISAFVQWSSEDTDVITITGRKLHAVEEGRTKIQASLNGVSSSAELITVRSLILTQLQVTEKVTRTQLIPSVSVSTPLGLSTYFQAVGVFNDGSTEDMTSRVQWKVSNSKVAVLDPNLAGKVDGKQVGRVVIQATLATANGLLASNSASLEVTNAVLASIQLTATSLTLPKGQDLQVVARGIFTDKTQKDLTSIVNWSSSDASIATVILGNLLSKKMGKVVIKAEHFGVLSELIIEVTPAEMVDLTLIAAQNSTPAGGQLQLKAQGVFSDGSTRDVTESAVWFSSDLAIGTIYNGLLSTKAEGKVRIEAKKEDLVSKVLEITVTPAQLVSIVITPNSPKVAYGNTLQLKAEGIYTDGKRLDLTEQVSWSSASAEIATVSTTGLVATTTTGAVSIFAVYQGEKTYQYLEVLAPKLERIAIKQKNVVLRLAIKESVPLKVIGYYSDGTESDVTNMVLWTNSKNDIVNVSTTGSVWPHKSGVSEVTANIKGLSSVKTQITVSDTDIASVTLSPGKLTLVKKDGLWLSAEVAFDDGTSIDLSKDMKFAGNLVWENDNKNAAKLYSLFLFASDLGKANFRGKYKSYVSGIVHESNTVMLDVIAAPVCGDKVNDTDMSNASGACLKVIEQEGKQYSSSPSKAFIDLLSGYQEGNVNDADPTRRYHSTYDENGNFGPAGEFVSFRNDTSSTFNTSSEYQSFCFHLARLSFNGRNNWRMMSFDELKKLAYVGDMFKDYGWPTSNAYWSKTRENHHLEYKYNTVGFVQGRPYRSVSQSFNGLYSSCISDL